jgi:SNF2 family DNA or RNA helicase
MSTWKISDSVLCISVDDRDVVPSTDELYSMAIEGASLAGFPTIEDAKSNLGLRFSPYPASVKLLLLKGQDALEIAIQAETQGGGKSNVGLSVLRAGHAVIGGVWYPINSDEVAQLRALASMSLFNDRLQVSSIQSLLSLKRLAATTEMVEDQTSGELFSALPLFRSKGEKPRGVNANLYAYQLEGWNWLRFLLQERVGGLLADEMGLGKTLQVISAIADPAGEQTLRPVLIVAPSSLLENWRREFEKFAPSLRILKHQGPRRTGRPTEFNDYDVIVSSYETVIRDQSLLTMINWRLIVADEAQNIKNSDALRSQSLKRLPREVALAMTGTPIENKLEDLWSVLDFVVPGYLGSLKDFEAQFTNDVDGASRLEPLVSPLMLRRRVASVAKDLPQRIDIPQALEFREEEAVNYEQLRAKISETYGRSASLVALTSLRQFCAHPKLLIDVSSIGESGEFTKLARLRELLEEIFSRQEKVLVFTSYTGMADIIEGLVVAEFGVFAKCLDGRLGIEARQPLIDQFSEIKGSAALILNPRAGGSGLNITAANHVIHYNLEWNPSLEDQASARAYRRGQILPVFVHRMFFVGTVEEVVDERVQRKRLLSDAAVVGIEGRDADYQDILTALDRSPLKLGAQS